MQSSPHRGQFAAKFQQALENSDKYSIRSLLISLPEIDERDRDSLVHTLKQYQGPTIFPVLLEIQKHILQLPEGQTEKLCKRIEGLILEIGRHHPEEVIAALASRKQYDLKAIVRIIVALHLQQALPPLTEILHTSEDISELKECMVAVATLSHGDVTAILAGFLRSQKDSFVHAAVAVLMDIGTPAAILTLRHAIDGSEKRDKLIIAILAYMPHPFALDKLSELLGSPIVNARNLCIEQLTQIGERALPFLAENLAHENEDVIIHSITIMKQIGSEIAIADILRVLSKNPANANIRFAAYEALGYLPSTKSAIRLTMGLEDPEEQVRLAAAKAIDNNITPLMLKGLKNLVAIRNNHSRAIVETLLNAKANRIFKELIQWQPFYDLATAYLAGSAAPGLRNHFQLLYKDLHHRELFYREKTTQGSAAHNRKLVYAIDDSPVMLNLYSKKLHEMGHIAVTFEDGREAVKTIEEARPDVVITDLNMPELDGLQVTARIRKLYDMETLPIIMITTQSDFTLPETVAALDGDEELSALGLNHLLYKPFSDRELGSAMQALH